jgi:hypothetical protein
MQTHVFRIGQIIDQFDYFTTQNLLMLYCADPMNPRRPRQIINTPSPLSPILSTNMQPLPHSTISEGKFLASAVNAMSTAAKTKKVPKPSNSWILYRKSKHHLVVAQNPGMHTSEICKLTNRKLTFRS